MFKYTVKLLTRESKMKDNGYVPIYLRITIGGKPAFISTGHDVPASMWDKKKERVKDGFMLSSSINPDISTRKQAIVQKMASIQVEGGSVTAAQAKLLFTGVDLHNIFEFSEVFIKEVKDKRAGSTLENYRKHLLVLEKFHGSRLVTFEQIDHKYLVAFEAWLRTKPAEKGRHPKKGEKNKKQHGPIGQNYIHSIWKTLKTFFNAAIKRKVITEYPFETYESPEYKAPKKDYLTLQEMDVLERIMHTTDDPILKESLMWELFGCYSGLRISDWYTFDYAKNVKNGRISLHAKKNGEWVTMQIVGRLGRILEMLKGRRLTLAQDMIRRYLKTLPIGKKIGPHTARHSFAITMCAEQGISAETCAELMAITLKTCVENYYKVTNRKIDKETVVWEGL